MLIPLLLLAAAAPSLVVELPYGITPKAASVTAGQLKLQTTGTIDGRKITFANLLPDTPYDVRVELADGAVLQGVDMSWYLPEPAGTKHEAMDEDDRKALEELFKEVKAFENKRNMLHLRGNHDNATVLAELIRDTGFYGDKGGQIIWRVEVWYYKNQHGGWERISQQNKVLRRERFSQQEYEKAKKIRWLPELGGIRLSRDETEKKIALPAK